METAHLGTTERAHVADVVFEATVVIRGIDNSPVGKRESRVSVAGHLVAATVSSRVGVDVRERDALQVAGVLFGLVLGAVAVDFAARSLPVELVVGEFVLVREVFQDGFGGQTSADCLVVVNADQAWWEITGLYDMVSGLLWSEVKSWTYCELQKAQGREEEGGLDLHVFDKRKLMVSGVVRENVLLTRCSGELSGHVRAGCEGPLYTIASDDWRLGMISRQLSH